MINIQEELADGTSVYGWKSEPPLTPFAPSYTHYFLEKKIFSGEECKEWNSYLLKQEQILLDKFRTTTGDGHTGLGVTSITSRFRDFNLLHFDFHLVEHFKTKIFDGICQLLDISGNTGWKETLYATCWFNVMRRGSGMEVHSHGYHQNSFYGFHLTINATETFTSYLHPIKGIDEAYHVPNNIGTLTLFPQFIPHSVTPTTSLNPRISIAGDIFPSTWLDEKSENYQGAKVLVEIGKLGDTK